MRGSCHSLRIQYVFVLRLGFLFPLNIAYVVVFYDTLLRHFTVRNRSTYTLRFITYELLLLGQLGGAVCSFSR